MTLMPLACASDVLGTEFGAPGRNRTCDLPLRRGPLYPLSYRGDSTGVSGDGTVAAF
jgi:hypothetical protein